ncbi:MAG: ATP-binding cassette domain-containing protein [Bacteroidota bacterium]
MNVELIGISKSYGDRFALQEVSVVFPFQKITAVIGRSGSGKSTLLKTINGLVKPTTGNVVAPGRRQIGYVVQGNGLYPHLTVGENISLPGRSRAKNILPG